jgi:hypothetical protein
MLIDLNKVVRTFSPRDLWSFSHIFKFIFFVFLISVSFVQFSFSQLSIEQCDVISVYPSSYPSSSQLSGLQNDFNFLKNECLNLISENDILQMFQQVFSSFNYPLSDFFCSPNSSFFTLSSIPDYVDRLIFFSRTFLDILDLFPST